MEIENLTMLCEKTNAQSNGNGEGISELRWVSLKIVCNLWETVFSKQKQAFQKERDHLIEETTKLRVAMQEAEEHIMELEESSAEGDFLFFFCHFVLSNFVIFRQSYLALQANAELRQEVQTRQNDLALQERQKDVMEKELKTSVFDCEEKTGEINTLQNQLMKTKDENIILSSQVKDLKLSAERSNKENRLLETRFNRLQGTKTTIRFL